MNAPIKDPVSPNLVQILETDEIAHAFHMMRNAHTRTALVINSKNEITGVITERDLDKAIGGKVYSSSYPLPLFEPTQKVMHYKSSPVKVIGKDVELKSICKGMIEDGIAAYLVKENNLISAIVTTEDLLRALYRILFEKSADRKNELESLFFSSSIGQFSEQKAKFDN